MACCLMAPEPMLTHHQWGLVPFTSEQFHKKCSWTWSVTCGNYTFKVTTFSRGQWVKRDPGCINGMIRKAHKNPFYICITTIGSVWASGAASLSKAQGSFCECAQPMRDGITLKRCLSLAGCIHKRTPKSNSGLGTNQCWKFPPVRQPEADNFCIGPATHLTKRSCWPATFLNHQNKNTEVYISQTHE